MTRFYRTIQGFYDYEMYKLDCTFVLVDDVIVESLFIDMDNGEFIDIRIFGLTPFDVLNDSSFRIEYDEKSIE